MISASFAAFAQATGSAQFYLGSVKSPHNTRGQLFFQEKQNCCIPGKFIFIPKHTEREERVPQSNSIGGLPLGCKDWPWEVFLPRRIWRSAVRKQWRGSAPSHRLQNSFAQLSLNTQNPRSQIPPIYDLVPFTKKSLVCFPCQFPMPFPLHFGTSPGGCPAQTASAHRREALQHEASIGTAVLPADGALHGSGRFSPGAGLWGRKGSQGAVVSPWNPLVLAIQSWTLGRCKGWKAQHVKDDCTFAGMCPKLWNGDEWWRMKKQSGINDWRPHHIDPIWSNHIQSYSDSKVCSFTFDWLQPIPQFFFFLDI